MRSIGKFMLFYQSIDATVGIFVASQHIIETILPGVSVRRSGRDSIVRHSALRQVEQRILKSPQTSQRGRHSTGNLGGVSLTRAELARALGLTKRTASQAARLLVDARLVTMRAGDAALIAIVP